jgi:hypothetical protein
MPIGTGATRGEVDEPLAILRAEESPARSDATVTDNAGLTIPKFEGAPTASFTASVPCAGCVELEVDVNDINQRDEFAFGLDGSRITRVVWTILVTFNSDQLAVQPFVDGKHGKYTALHVNTFPLRTPVEVEQEFKGKAKTVGLVVGSSGAWTGNQTMSVFVDSVRVEGAHPSTRSFATGTEGLEPRTHTHHPNVVFHPEK